MISKEEFLRFKDEGYNIIPLVKSVYLNEDTPLCIYSKISDIGNTFLLESVEGGKKWAQYSIIGLNCEETISLNENEIQISSHSNISTISSDKPFDYIQNLLDKYKVAEQKDLPRFYGGYVGFFSYETSRYAEKKLFSLKKNSSIYNSEMPELFLVKAEELIIYDNHDQSVKIVLNVNPQEKTFEEALEAIKDIEILLESTESPSYEPFKKVKGLKKFKTNFEKPYYKDAVLKIKDYILEGDVMQVVLAQHFSEDFNGSPFDLYRALRELNPSPYMYLLNFKDLVVVGSSPEILIRVEDGEVTLRPIAGTRPRGLNQEEDNKNEEDLLSDPKELAEHLMLIDLGRNDVGKISKIGTVKVTDKMIIERYSHVMHIVSNVIGELKDDESLMSAIKSSLPAGTLSGAPKIRAMEIINELEPNQRGIYGGAIGYISWNGNMDSAIAIRTAVIKDNQIYVGAGAGVVADSDPDKEWEECNQKSKVFLDALEMIE